MNSAPKGEGDMFIRQSLEYREHIQKQYTLAYPLVFRNIDMFVSLYESTLISFFDLQLRRLWVNGELGFCLRSALCTKEYG
jgi:hypothetical protein